ncbi:TRPM8 channel-associated factor homolog [Lissotriton helveticus]
MTPNEAYKNLIKGLNVLDFTEHEAPCQLLLSGEKAFPIMLSAKGEVLIAASHYGKGRVVVISHEGYLKSRNFTSFLQNALEWLKPSRDALIGIHTSFDLLLKTIHGNKVQSSAQFSDCFGVYCMNAYDDSQYRDIIMSIKRGAGILIGGQARTWSHHHGLVNVMDEFPGNKVTSVAGIHFTGNIAEAGIFPVTKDMPINPVLVQHGMDLLKDQKVLLKDVSELNLKDSGIPSLLLLHGATAFPVGPLAAAHYGRGRVLVLTHERQIGALKLKRFLLNAIAWLDAGRKGKVGVERGLKHLQALLNQESIACELSDLKQDFTVYCCTASISAEAQKFQEFVAEGGGLLIGGQAWWWARQNPYGDVIAEYPGNKIINHFGISILGSLSKAVAYKTSAAEGTELHYHFRTAFSYLQQQMSSSQDFQAPLTSWLGSLAQDCSAILKTKAGNSQVFSPIQQTILKLIQKTGICKVSVKEPIKGSSKEAFVLRLAASLGSTVPSVETYLTSLVKSPQEFSVSGLEKLQINGTTGGSQTWRSTGLYLAPGKSATIVFPDAAVNVGLQVQIGCHTDDLKSASTLKRPPLVFQRYFVDKKVLLIASLWGGLLYIIVPSRRKLGQVPLTVEGAVLAPFYKYGETSNSSWTETICHYSAPWSELATDNIILTVPSDYVRSLENPAELLSLWDKMMKAVAELSGVHFPLARPERIVADVQISGGWMHSGYPIMCHVQSAKSLVDAKSILSKGLWGPIHELGHNQQRSEWQIMPHTFEAMCNMWTVYVHEKVLNISRNKAHPNLQDEERRARTIRYLENGSRLENWHEATCLETYLQLQEGFGWEPFKQLFSAYHNISKVKKENKYKMNLWADMFSKAVGKNLVSFFKLWGWPIDNEVSNNLSSLPDWEEDPMKKYVMKLATIRN